MKLFFFCHSLVTDIVILCLCHMSKIRLFYCCQVHSLSLILNKKFSEIARANVSKLSVHLELLGG